MLRAGYIIGTVLLVGLGIYVFVLHGNKPSVPIVKEGTAIPIVQVPVGAWIEIVNGTASTISEEGVIAPLKTGDKINAPVNISTDSNSAAIIHFPDGSELRLAVKTYIQLADFSYNQTSGGIVVDASLATGRVWSKVIGLLTPDSLWQVETPNAVAKVRGTAFGVSYATGTSLFVGSEHDVSVFLKDKDTDKEFKDASTTVKENQTLEVSDGKVATMVAQLKTASSTLSRKNIIALAKVLVPKNKVVSKKEDDWVIQNEEKDDEIEGIKKESHYDPMVGTSGRGVFEDAVKEKLKKEVLNKKENNEGDNDNHTDNVRSSSREDSTHTSSAVPHEENENSSFDDRDMENKETGLSIDKEINGKEFEADSLVSFKVYFTDRNGTLLDVTSSIDWTFDTQFLSKKAPGVFVVNFPDSLSESGPQKTTIGVNYKNTQTKTEYSASYKIIVKPHVDDTVPLGMKIKGGNQVASVSSVSRPMPTVSRLKETVPLLVATTTLSALRVGDMRPSIVR